SKRRARPRRHPGEPHRTTDDAPRPRQRARLRQLLGTARGRPRRDRARLPRLPTGKRRVRNVGARGGAVVTWVSWRLQRTETLIALGILALLAALLIPTGIQMANAYHQDGIAACLSINPSKPVLCGNELGNFQQRFKALTTLANWFTLIPGLIGVLLAAPFIFDLEQGTYRLAWTQSITRGRWLFGKLELSVVAAVLASGALILLFTWWRAPNVHINGRLDTGNYDTTGTVVIG